MTEDKKKAYTLFAEILEYPGLRLKESARECTELLMDVDKGAASLMESFNSFASEALPVRIEEIYTRTFDLQPICYPYAGYQLFGESYKRGTFMVGLKEKYREYGYSVDNELPDHIPVILRFLSILTDEDEAEIIVGDCLAPVLAKMVEAFEEGENPYIFVMRSLLSLLENGKYGRREGKEGKSSAREANHE